MRESMFNLLKVKKRKKKKKKEKKITNIYARKSEESFNKKVKMFYKMKTNFQLNGGKKNIKEKWSLVIQTRPDIP